MRQRVGAIIFEDDAIILLKRVTEERTYWVFPGGEIDPGETKEEAMVRECKEELGIDVKILKPFTELVHYPYGNKQKEYFFLCEKTGGRLGTGTGPEFSGDPKYAYRGSYEAVKVTKKEIQDLNLLPEEVKKMLV
jgi:8-oxo-dGTP diphosphatase